jgi:hypothetical protein
LAMRRMRDIPRFLDNDMDRRLLYLPLGRKSWQSSIERAACLNQAERSTYFPTEGQGNES